MANPIERPQIEFFQEYLTIGITAFFLKPRDIILLLTYIEDQT